MSSSLLILLFYPAIIWSVLLVFLSWGYARKFFKFDDLVGQQFSGNYVSLFAFVFFLMIASMITTLPLPKAFEALCNLTNGQAKIVFDLSLPWKNLGSSDDISYLVRNAYVRQFGFNIIMALPIGFFFRMQFNLKVERVLVAGILISVFWEVTQITAVWGLAPCSYRTFDLNDIVANVLGVSVGLILFLIYDTIFTRCKL